MEVSEGPRVEPSKELGWSRPEGLGWSSPEGLGWTSPEVEQS